MTFDISKFETTSFKHREVSIEVPELKEFFPEGEKCEWLVRGLTGPELAVVNEAVESNKNISGIVAAIANQAKSEKANAVIEMLGLSGETVPTDMVRRFAMLVHGSVSPKCPQSIAVKLGDTFPTTLYKLTNKIIELTGEGKLGESKPCGPTKKSK